MDKIEVDLGWCTLVIEEGKVGVLVRGLDSEATVTRWSRGDAVAVLTGNCFTVTKPESKVEPEQGAEFFIAQEIEFREDDKWIAAVIAEKRADKAILWTLDTPGGIERELEVPYTNIRKSSRYYK